MCDQDFYGMNYASGSSGKYLVYHVGVADGGAVVARLDLQYTRLWF